MASGVPALDAIAVTALRPIALFTVAPLFGHRTVPVRVRLMLAFTLAVLLTPLLPVPATDRAVGPGLVLGEILIGVTLGFSVRLLFAGLDVLAEAVSIQGGLGAAQVIDPASGNPSASFGALFTMVGIGVWLAIGGHHDLLRALVGSYELLPVGAGGPPREAFLAVVGLAAPVFRLGLQLAAPVTVAMMVSNAAVGVLGRTIPQLNLITLQLPAHVAATFLILALGAWSMVDIVGGAMTGWTDRGVAALLGE